MKQLVNFSLYLFVVTFFSCNPKNECLIIKNDVFPELNLSNGKHEYQYDIDSDSEMDIEVIVDKNIGLVGNHISIMMKPLSNNYAINSLEKVYSICKDTLVAESDSNTYNYYEIYNCDVADLAFRKDTNGTAVIQQSIEDNSLKNLSFSNGEAQLYEKIFVYHTLTFPESNRSIDIEKSAFSELESGWVVIRGKSDELFGMQFEFNKMSNLNIKLELIKIEKLNCTE